MEDRKALRIQEVERKLLRLSWLISQIGERIWRGRRHIFWVGQGLADTYVFLNDKNHNMIYKERKTILKWKKKLSRSIAG